MSPTEKCVLCRQPGTRANPINSHHYRGRKKYPGLTMRVHSLTCHRFGDWVTSLYIARGEENILEPKHLVYLFNRVATVRHNGIFILPIF